jgi:hypothetical protein
MTVVRIVLAVVVAAMLPGPTGAQDYSVEGHGAAEGSGEPNFLPPGWRLVQGDPSHWAQRFVSPDGLSTFSTVAAPADRDARSYLRAFASAPGERVTYQRHGRGWMVVSGYRDDKIFYRKALLGCDGVWLNFAFEYPAAQKRAFDGLVTRASKQFNRRNDPQCAQRRD